MSAKTPDKQEQKSTPEANRGKDPKEKQVPEVVGLDDSDLGETSPVEKKSILTKLKVYLVPTAVGLGSLVLASVAAKFTAGPKEPSEPSELSDQAHQEDMEGVLNLTEAVPTEQDMAENLANTEAESESESANDSHSQLNEPGFDTSQALEELARLGFGDFKEKESSPIKEVPATTKLRTPESSGKSIAASDSVDTLRWLDKEMARIKLEEARLTQLRKQVYQETDSLTEIKEKLDRVQKSLEQAESSRIVELARLYDSMKPEDVVKLFENLDDEAVMAILPRMKSANAAKILGQMPPKRAAKISTKMITILED